MDEKIKLLIGVFILLAAVGTTYFVTVEDQPNLYSCGKTVGLCWKLSNPGKYNFSTRCYYNESAPARYKNCKTGWFKIDLKEFTGIEVPHIEDNCKEVIEFYEVSFPIHDVKEVYSEENKTYYNVTIFVKHDIIKKNRTLKVCEPFAVIDGKNIDFKKQGYNCKDTSKGIICDSCIDGNCDGICDHGGGETCCKIDNDGVMICKNSQLEWIDTKVYVNRLEVKE